MNRFLIALVCTGALIAAAPRACDPFVLDKCTAKVLFFAQNTTATVEPSEVAWACEQEKIAIECLKEHNKNCVTGLAQGVSKLVIEGATQESDLKCEVGGPKNKDYYKYVPCINKNGRKLNKCMMDATKATEAATQVPAKERVAQMCCGLHKLEACVVAATRETCDSKHANYVKGVIAGVAGDLLETVCAKFGPNTNSCKNLSPMKISRTQKYLTIIPPVVEVLQSLK
ncbi:uncharacterized protein LOC100899845 [Galendromus occidentalis]|uniref:Uncharacterized protein LOC100899845 n=1 Tax=Galendromus occidentalis TaxID=34638 RepID=A0AAJ6VYF6_9ACAR|nr:uncharacterized protein LOC100899845 [Galendromus occidentalis]